MVEKLKPCPFCGCVDIVVEPYAKVIGVSLDAAPNMYMVHCNEIADGCEASIVRLTKVAAIAAWNTRTPAGSEPVADKREPLPEGFLGHDEATDWISTNCMAIRRDNGDMDYSLGAMIKAYEAGKASTPSPEAAQIVAENERLKAALLDMLECGDRASRHAAREALEPKPLDHDAVRNHLETGRG